MLTVALPKGRIADETLDIFQQIFDTEFVFEDRKLILEKDNFRFLLVRNQDVPTYVYNQAADIGVVGLDVIEEKEYDLVKLLDLGIGKCRVCVGIKSGCDIDYTKPEIKVATKMTNIAQKYFSQKAMAVDVIKLYGSIELAPIVGLSDVIVDIVETGTTMKQNGLEVAEDIMTSSAHLISNKNSYYEKKSEILSLYEKISKVIGSK
jgi:ATP phosphoribosyltransferase